MKLYPLLPFVIIVFTKQILEGPEQHATRALEIVKKCMTNPLDEPLLIKLEVDAKIAKSWYKGK
jgi:DNA polymerase I-like protein with 3'-5' exonuclease and polymerase domains